MVPKPGVNSPVNLIAMNRSFAALALVSAAIGLLLLVALAFPSGRARLAQEVGGQGRTVLAFAWVVSVIATGGSLYYSEIVGFTPCLLCWYQRIAMYPLVPVLGIAALTGDVRSWRYSVPLAAIGLAIAIYHVTIQFRPALEITACLESVPCTARYVSAFGFVSIPVMAGGGFLLISALVLTARLDRWG